MEVKSMNEVKEAFKKVITISEKENATPEE